VCVPALGRAWIKLGEQNSVRAQKKPENAARAQRSPARQVCAPQENANVLFPERNWGAMGVSCKWQTHRPYKAMETGFLPSRGATVVTDQYDPSLGGTTSDPV